MLVFNILHLLTKSIEYWLVDIHSFPYLSDRVQRLVWPLRSSWKMKEAVSKEIASNVLKLKIRRFTSWHLEEQFANIWLSLAFIQPWDLHFTKTNLHRHHDRHGDKNGEQKFMIPAVVELIV